MFCTFVKIKSFGLKNVLNGLLALEILLTLKVGKVKQDVHKGPELDVPSGILRQARAP